MPPCRKELAISYEPPGTSSSPPPKKSSATPWIIAIVAIVLFLVLVGFCALGAGYWFLLAPGKAPGKVSARPVEPASTDMAWPEPTSLPMEGVAVEVRPSSPPLVVLIDREGRVSVDGHPLDPPRRIAMFRDAAAADPNRAGCIEARRDVPYGEVVRIMDELREAGFTQIGLHTLD